MKILGIGIFKTGTHSLASALTVLGYNTLHIDDGPSELTTCDAYITNGKIPLKALAADFSGAKLIHTRRDREEWITSCLEHVVSCRKGIREKTWMEVNTDDLRKRFDAHEEAVEGIKSGRDWLSIDICKGAGWREICEFLDLNIPNRPFPRTNLGSYHTAF